MLYTPYDSMMWDRRLAGWDWKATTDEPVNSRRFLNNDFSKSVTEQVPQHRPLTFCFGGLICLSTCSGLRRNDAIRRDTRGCARRPESWRWCRRKAFQLPRNNWRCVLTWRSSRQLDTRCRTRPAARKLPGCFHGCRLRRPSTSTNRTCMHHIAPHLLYPVVGHYNRPSLYVLGSTGLLILKASKLIRESLKLIFTRWLTVLAL